ncbi:hypothetical protein DFH07DRAFT_961690 [Mycena maculata]|uniref:BTB domain-containing protein n=1 Tax=Mycena maculata TaxID=230809 RepID=A0AAD7ISG4_9AGAR|nr:hypothetical protein DFH07DRAFT_961690 [Mycena maculata]
MSTPDQTGTKMGTNRGSYEPVENGGQFTRHAKYWFKDGSIVVDETTIYKIHESQLELSEGMKSILTIPDGKEPGDPTREGTEHYPLFIPQTSVAKFDDFLRWIYRAEWEPLGADDHEREHICTHLLELSDLWEIEAAKRYAILALQYMPLIPSLRRLQLARMFTINDWVEPAVKKIFDDGLTTLTDNDLTAMGLKVYSIFVKAQAQMEIETRRTAFVGPVMDKDSAWQCPNHASCIAVWPKLWFDKIGKKLLHTTNPIKLSEIQAEAEKDETFVHPGLSNPCRLDMVLRVCHGTTFAHERIIPACAASIINYYNSL